LKSFETVLNQLEEFEKAVRLSHKRCGDNDSSSTRHKQFVTAIENQIHRVETSLQEAYSENGKKPLRWVDLNEEERDDLAMFLSGSSRTSQSFSGESSIKSRESTNSSLVENVMEVSAKVTFKKAKVYGDGSECVIDIEERVTPGQAEKSVGLRRIWSSPNFNSLRIIVPGGDNEEEKETLVAQIEATPKVKGTKSVLWMQRLPDHNQLFDKTGCFQNPIRLPFNHPIKFIVSLLLMVFLLLPFVVYLS
jgi:hypothetical protein